jgi:protein SCO1/2
VEASHRKIGSLTDALLLSCYHFDPTKGKYTWAVMGTVRVAGTLTVLGLGVLIGVLFRRERRLGTVPDSPPPDGRQR